MLRYVLVFILVNTYGLSLGLPLGQQTDNGTIMIGNLLNELAKGCKNEFVVSLINSKLDECNLKMPPIHDRQIRCLMFYDASVVLCNSTANSPKLATEFAVKTKVKQDLPMFCAEAVNLSLLPTRFRTNITEVLYNNTLCTIVCADEVLFSGDTSFYCKYYKWMLDTVHSQIPPVINTIPNQVSIDGPKKINDTLVTDAASVSEAIPKKDEVKESSSDNNNKISSTNTDDANQIHVEAVQPEPSLAPLPNLKKAQNSSDAAVDNPLENNIDDAQDKLEKEDAKSVHIEHVLPENSVGHGIEAPKPNMGLDGEEDDQGIDDNDDQGDPDAGGEGMEDIDLGNKPENDDKKSVKQEEAPIIINSESSHADTYLNPIDGYTDDDDHFFPFFLTAVIVVVVLYVLYHNKNKVGKMFFGLIVEGRQTGRRRNSRGHAYRRLDTLEQAMSANTAAPPSKIIY